MMNDDLIQACVRGVVAETVGPEGDVPVDFVLPAEKLPMTAVLTAGWWAREWAPGTGLHVYHAVLDTGVDGWALEGVPGLTFTGMEPDMHTGAVATQARYQRLRDIERDDYLLQLQYLQEQLGDEFDVSPWRAAVVAIPVVDPVAEMLAANTAARMVGRVILSDGVQPAASAAFDMLGNVALAGESSWLRGVLRDWQSRLSAGSDERDLADHIRMLSETTQRGNLIVHTADVSRAIGPIQDIARSGLN